MPQCMIGLPMVYGRLRTATRLATAALLVGGCGRIGFEDHAPVDAEPACAPAVQIAAIDGGYDYYCAQLVDNSLQCWGANDIGQLGNSTRTSSPTTVTPLNLPDVTAFATGYQHTCAVRQGDVLCWGRNDIGQLGQGDRLGRAVPARVNGLPGDMVGVAAGGLTTCAWDVDGALYCWGQTNGTTMTPSNTPRLVTGIPPVRDVALSTTRAFFSADHGCAIGTDGSAWCWGDNNQNQFGNGTTVDSQTPMPVSAGPIFESLAAGNAHTCARTSSNELYCWGLNIDGQGGGTMNRLTSPTLVAGVDAVEIDAKGENTCARTTNGDVLCFGDNDVRQLGRDGGDAFAPERIPLPPAAQLAVGTSSSCALGTDGVLRCWGSDRSGVISGTVVSAMTTTIPDVSSIDAGGDNTCAISNGTVRCWGSGSVGQLGTGGSRSPTSEPTIVTLPRPATSIAVGALHACATLDDDSTRCWGWNESRQVDQDTSLIRPTVPPVGTPASTYVVTGAGHTCTFSVGATSPWCWGNNSEGALGLPNGASGMVPAQSSFPAFMSEMDAGRFHTCGITTAGDLFCTGRNNEHQVGDGGTSDVYTPVQLPLTMVGRIGLGDYHSCAVTVAATNTVWCWGEAIAGQLGLGTNVEADVPVALAPLGANPVEIVGGHAHTCARSGAGEIWCWGSNTDGQLGDGTLNTVATPTIVSELTGSTQITAGQRHTCGLLPNGDIRCVGGNDMGQLGGGMPVASAAPRQSRITCPEN